MCKNIKQLEPEENKQLRKQAEKLKHKYPKWSEVYENFQVKHEIIDKYIIVKIIGIPHADVLKILCNYILAGEYHNEQMITNVE